MSAPYSTLITALKNFSDVTSPVAPPDTVWVLRDIAIYVGQGQPAVSVMILGTQGQVLLGLNAAALLGGYVHTELRQVIPPGESYTVAVAGGAADITVSGYSLDAD